MSTLKQLTIAASTLAALLWAEAAAAQDRLSLSGSGTTLTGTNGGGGGALTWLHNFGPDVLGGLGGEYQTIGDAHWAFGTLNAAYVGGPTEARWSVSGQVKRGSGWNGVRNFTYQDASLDASLPLVRKLSLQLEERQIDIDTSHGSLPKVALAYLVTPKLLTTVSYATSVGGNLGTRIGSGRLDYYHGDMHYMAGGATGTVDPLVLNLPAGLHIEASHLSEGYAGFGASTARAEWLLLGDYQRLGHSERVTVTLSVTFALNGVKAGPPRS